MKVGVKILPREEVLDTQGRAVERMLKQNGKSVSACRVGKYVQIEVEGTNKDEAESQVKDIAEYVLYNPLTETYELEFYDS